jgi:ABC-type glutathione transport system ATPase component
MSEAQPRPALIVAEQLEKEYRTGSEAVRVLKGVNLTVHQGELVAVVGASGSRRCSTSSARSIARPPAASCSAIRTSSPGPTPS